MRQVTAAVVPGESASLDSPTAAVRWSVCVSAVRCLLTYVATPIVGGLGGLLGAVGVSLQVLACGVALLNTRTLWLRRHRARIPYTALAAVVVLATVGSLSQVAAAIDGR